MFPRKFFRFQIIISWSPVANDFALRRIVAAAETAGQSNVLVVSHGTASLLWLRAHGGVLPNRTELTNASVSKVTYQDGRFKVAWLDNTSFRDQGLKEAWTHDA